MFGGGGGGHRNPLLLALSPIELNLFEETILEISGNRTQEARQNCLYKDFAVVFFQMLILLRVCEILPPFKFFFGKVKGVMRKLKATNASPHRKRVKESDQVCSIGVEPVLRSIQNFPLLKCSSQVHSHEIDLIHGI